MNQTTSSRATSLAQIGGALGIAGCFIGLGIFLVACAGFSAVFMLSILPLILGAVGFVLSIVGPNLQKGAHFDDSCVFAAIFTNVMSVVGALLLMAVWLGWKVLP